VNRQSLFRKWPAKCQALRKCLALGGFHPSRRRGRHGQLF
jgi:hypothetical protein